jgi:ATP-dependent RNA helicase SUPV3L1/SUV3
MLENPPDLAGVARGIAFQASEALGVLDRARVAQDMKSLDQEGRAKLRALGLRFGAYHIYAPALLKPAPRALATQLYALKHGGLNMSGLETIMQFASSGRTSFPADPEAPKALYRAAGFRLCGKRAVRVDILERLADLIRPAVQYKPGITQGTPPGGAADGDGFVVTGQMTSLAGCAGEDFSAILTSLGYVSTKRPGPAITVPLATPPVPAPVPAGATDAQQAGADGLAVPAAPSMPSDDEPFLPGIEEADAANALAPVASAPEAAPATPEPTEALATTPATGAADPPAASADGSSQGPVAGDAATADGDAAAASAEPELIEVWRQQRPAQRHHRPHGAGQGPAERRERGRRERGPRPPEQRQPAAGAGPDGQAVAEAQAAPERKAEGAEARGADTANRQRRRDRQHGPRLDRRADGQPNRNELTQTQAASRPDKRTAEKRPPKAIDPDNPFAKLLALKARMEEEGRR